MRTARGHKSMRPGRRDRQAFTLVELVMVVAIIGIIAAIAAPRLSGAARGASGIALESSIASIRKAIDAYYAEHDRYPGSASGGTPDGSDFVDQLLMYSDAGGDTAATFGAPYIYGPYLRPPFPRNPTNDLNDVHVKTDPAAADPASGTVGWVAVLSHGYFVISASNADLDGIVKDPKKRDALRTY